jgi:hypothetical protein
MLTITEFIKSEISIQTWRKKFTINIKRPMDPRNECICLRNAENVRKGKRYIMEYNRCLKKIKIRWRLINGLINLAFMNILQTIKFLSLANTPYTSKLIRQKKKFNHNWLFKHGDLGKWKEMVFQRVEKY